MEQFLKFIASPAGRGVRILAGLGLIGAGVLGEGGPKWSLVVAGLVPLGAGLLDKCLLAPFIGRPFSGEALRRQLEQEE